MGKLRREPEPAAEGCMVGENTERAAAPAMAPESKAEPERAAPPAPAPEPKMTVEDFGMTSPTDRITFAGFRVAMAQADGGRARRRTLAEWRQAFVGWQKGA